MTAPNENNDSAIPPNKEAGKTPLLLIVGFLGAGKTTLLRPIIKMCRALGLTPHVVLNDYENASVDAAELRDAISDIIPIRGSCVCCSSRYELLEALSRQPSGNSDVVIVETNGTTDSASLLTLLAASPSVAHLQSPVQLSVVDGLRWQKRGRYNFLEELQFKTASHFVVSRIDQIPETRLHTVLASAAAINPYAKQVEMKDFKIVLADLATTAHPAKSEAPESGAPEDAEARHKHHHFASLSLPIPAPVDRTTFLQYLNALPTQVVRAKGVVTFLEQPNEKRMFQRVEDQTDLSPHALNNAQDVDPVLILIGPHLDGDKIKDDLANMVS